MQNAYEFLNETFRTENGEKKLFFCKLSIKDDNFFTQIYIYDDNKKNIYMLIYKKVQKNVNAFFIKSLPTSKELIRRNSICCLKNQVIFDRVSIEIGLTPPLPLFVFIHSLRTPFPLPQQTQAFPQVLRTWGTFQNLMGRA